MTTHYEVDGEDIGDGWKPLVRKTLRKIKIYCKNSGQEFPEITDVKEKFGGLRIYTNGSDSKVQEMITEAEKESYHTCELCGKVGRLRTVAWYKTLCKEHWLKDKVNFTPKGRETIKKLYEEAWGELAE